MCIAQSMFYYCRNSYTVYSEPEDFQNESSERNCGNDSELCKVISNMEDIRNETLPSYETNTVDSFVEEMKSELCKNNQELHVLLPSSQG